MGLRVTGDQFLPVRLYYAPNDSRWRFEELEGVPASTWPVKQRFMSLADFEMSNLWPFSTGR